MAKRRPVVVERERVGEAPMPEPASDKSRREEMTTADTEFEDREYSL